MSGFLPSPLRSHVPTRARGPARRHASQAGFTVMEAGVAGAVITVFLTSLFALNSNIMHLLRSAAEAASASQDLQQRVETVRLSNWNQITDPNWVQANLLANKTDASVNLPGLSETLTVTPYLSPASAPMAGTTPPPFTVTRNADNTVTVNPPGYTATAALGQQEMVRVDLSVYWPSIYRSRTRSLTTLVSRWGISK